MEARQVRSLLVLLAVVVTYTLPDHMPNPPLAFYVMRGWLGVLLLWGLLRGWRIHVAVFGVAAVFEASTSICGALFLTGGPAFGSVCDNGTGLPLTLPVLTGSVLAALSTMLGNDNSRGSDD